jgi:hypothetical protein
MKAARFRSGDSLDLLLDTMCNTFGGIIMIAILVALLAQKSPSPIVPAERARSEMTERRLANAETELAAARALRAQLEVTASPALADRANERQRLADALRVAQTTADAQASQTAQSAAMKSADPGKILADLAAKSAAQERRASDVQNALAAQSQNSERLRTRLAELATQIEKEFDTRTKQLRLPKERAKTKGPFNVILKFGRAYPLTDSRGERNVKSIEWSERLSSHRARPIVGSGDDAASLTRLFQALTREEVYVAFYVYPDAFETFAAAREAAANAGLDYGLEIVRAGTELSFGSDGTSPPPL